MDRDRFVEDPTECVIEIAAGTTAMPEKDGGEMK